jgi:hypothetical protein
MDRRKLFLALLVAWVLVISAGGIYRLVALGKLTANEGPQALERDGHGGSYLATSRELLHLDEQGNVRERRSADMLGLKEINAIASGTDGVLWLYDSEARRIFRCTTAALACTGTTADIGLDKNVSLAWLTTQQQLLVADNAHHRLLTLDAGGRLLSAGGKAWHYPNQLMSTPDALLLADSDRWQIVKLDAAGKTRLDVALATTERPYRYARRNNGHENEWWVIEAGVSLLDGRLRHYHSGSSDRIALPASDPVALLDNGSDILVASKADWQLLALDPHSGNALPYGSAALQQEFRDHERASTGARKERSRLPLLMLALMAPALLGGVVLQRRIDSSPRSLPASVAGRVQRPMATLTPSSKPAPQSKTQVRIDTDRAALELQRAQQNRIAALAGVLLLGLVAAIGLILFFSGPHSTALVVIFGSIVALVVVLGLAFYASRRKQDRRYDQHFLCGPDKLVHVVQGKPRKAWPYASIWLGSESLVLGKERLSLYQGHGKQRIPFWSYADVQREIGARIPPGQNLANDIDLGRALMKQNLWLGLRVVAARYTVAIAVVLVLLLKAWNFIQHFWGVKLWQVMH